MGSWVESRAGRRVAYHTADIDTITGFRLLSRSVLLTPGKKAAAPVAAGNQAAAIALKSLDPMSWGGSVGRWEGWVGEDRGQLQANPLWCAGKAALAPPALVQLPATLPHSPTLSCAWLVM